MSIFQLGLMVHPPLYIVTDANQRRIELRGEVVKNMMLNTDFNGDFIVISHGQDGMAICGNEDLGETA